MEKLRNLIVIIFAFSLLHFSNYVISRDCLSPRPTPELIFNGDFELGFVGFYTTYDTNYIKFSKNIKVTSNPNSLYYTFDSCQDPTKPNGKFLIINGNDVFDTTEIIWRQVVRIEPQTYYIFKYKYSNIDIKHEVNNNLPIIQVDFNGEVVDVVDVEPQTCDWKEKKIMWYSNFYDSVVITFRDLRHAFFGNDFALDDISLISECKLVACAGDNIEICEGDTVQLGVPEYNSARFGFKPYTYKWYPEESLSSAYVPCPLAFPKETTRYIFAVTDSLGCIAYDTVTVFVRPKPDVKIITDKDTSICPCDSITLTVVGGDQFQWSTGDTTRSIVVKDSGYYFVAASNNFGCTSTAGININKKPVTAQIKIDTTEANIGDIVSIPIKITNENNLFDCKYNNYKAKISYNKSILLPIGKKANSIDNNNEEIELEGTTLTDLIDNLRFFVTLGDSEYTDVAFEIFEWVCDKVETEKFNGRLYVSGLCKEGGKRLVDLSKSLFLSNVQPNPISEKGYVYFKPIEKGQNSLKIYNTFGQIIKEITQNSFDLQEIIYEIDATELPVGLYFLILETPTTTITRSFTVLR